MLIVHDKHELIISYYSFSVGASRWGGRAECPQNRQVVGQVGRVVGGGAGGGGGGEAAEIEPVELEQGQKAGKSPHVGAVKMVEGLGEGEVFA